MIKGIKCIVVQKIIQARYKNLKKPADWSLRVSGVDIVKGEDGCIYKLFSQSDQSVPRPGSILVLEPYQTSTESEVFSWTLYGFKPETEVFLDEF